MNPSEQNAVAYCRACGKALAPAEQRLALGTVYCEEHVPAARAAEQSPYTAASPMQMAGAPSPGLAFVLGLIPGVGAIYNGQYGKGLIHVVVFGLLISIVNHESGDFGALFGMMIPTWVFYMAFEAYHTARKRLLGEPVDEFSSILPMKGGTNGFPIGPIIVIALGVLFLLNNLELLRLYQIIRFWPVLLIALGVFMLFSRLRGASTVEPVREVSHERQ